MTYKQTDASGQVADLGKLVVETITDDRTLTAADSGKIFLIGTDAKTVTLPATIKGFQATFINSGVPGNNIIKVSPVSLDGIAGTITLAGTVVVLDGTVNKAAQNTKATSVTGDSITIVGTGITGTKAWIVTASTGIWARQA